MLEWTFLNNINYYRFNPPGLGDIILDESRKYVLENGEIISTNYMKTNQNIVDKLRDNLINDYIYL
jgi:hypothetical protein